MVLKCEDDSLKFRLVATVMAKCYKLLAFGRG